MNCLNCKEYLDDYIRGFLPKEDHDLVASHLISCPNCSEEYESMGALFAVLDKEPKPVIDPSDLVNFMPEIWGKIEPVKAKGRNYWVSRLVPIFSAAAIMTMLIFRPNVSSLKVADQSGNYTQVAAVTDSIQYNQNTYQALLLTLFANDSTEVLDIFENELDVNAGVLVSGSIETELNNLTDEGLEVIDKKLSEMRGNEG
jgi:hypothetical protein